MRGAYFPPTKDGWFSRLIIMKLYFNENIHKILEDYPSSWNAEEFAKLNSFFARKEYAENHLKRISSGSSRIVYQIDNQKALKLAKNKKGIAQNLQEINMHNDSFFSNETLFAQLHSYDEKGLWIEMDLARKFTKSMSQKLIGLKWDEYLEFLQWSKAHYERGGNPRNIFGKEKEDYFLTFLDEGDYEFLEQMYYFLLDSQLDAIGDFMRPSTYGVIREDGEDVIKIVDYGLNDQVAKDYY